MTLRRLIWRNLCHYRLVNLATMVGVIVGVAAITGSLLVEDSIRISLRRLAVERLGAVDSALTAGDMFDESLAERMQEKMGDVPQARMHPAIVLDGIVRAAGDPAGAAPIAGVQVIAARGDGWDVVELPGSRPEGRQATLNRQLADELGVESGDALIVTVMRRGQAPVDTLFGRRSLDELGRRARVTVGEIVESRFTLARDEVRPRSLFLDLDWTQGAFDFRTQANTLLATGEPPSELAYADLLADSMTLEDYGLELAGVPDRPGVAVVRSTRVIVPPRMRAAASRAAEEHSAGARAYSMYLANTMTPEADGGTVPYSVVMGIDGGLGPFADGQALGAPGPNEIILVDWAADDMGAQPGDTVAVEWYVTGRDGELDTARADFRVKGIVPMRLAALTRGMVPEFEGVTERTSMLDWDAPFPIDYGLIRPKDEMYWRDHGPAPKAFLAFETVRRMWTPGGDGWEAEGAAVGGGVTGLALVKEDGPLDRHRLAESLRQALEPAEAGLAFLPLREQALRSAEGSTDFSVLFLSMSFFVVAAAVGLVALLVRLSVERRASELGLLQCVGFRESSVRRALLAEGVAVALVGAVVGAAGGAFYSRMVIAALSAQWEGAVAGFPVRHHVTASGLVYGGLAGFVVALLAMAWAARLLRKRRTLTLLFGWRALAKPPSPRAAKVAWRAAAALVVVAALLGALSYDGWVLPAQGGFFGSGAGLLLAGMCALCAMLSHPSWRRRPPASARALALRDAPRTWLRDLLAMGLIAAATFILVTVGANQRDLTRMDTRRLDSGAGGFPLVARTRFGIHHDLDRRQGLERVVAGAADMDLLAESRILGLRVREGDDASCLNIQQPLSPRILGAPEELVRRGGFSFTSTLGAPRDNPWEMLDEPLEDGEVPAFADAESAQWILGKSLGDTIEVEGQDGRVARLKLVGLLRQSVFASELIVSESRFERLFGREQGYRRFLVEPPEGRTGDAEAALRQGLEEAGVEVQRTAEILANYARVQNSYLIAFQTLGGLGLLLGVFGVVVVLLRNIWERRQEFALMLALGFTRGGLVSIVLMQNGLWLVAGVALGAVSALLATAPHLLSEIADVSWGPLLGTLAAVLGIGLASCAVAAALSVRSGLIQALRSE